MFLHSKLPSLSQFPYNYQRLPNLSFQILKQKPLSRQKFELVTSSYTGKSSHLLNATIHLARSISIQQRVQPKFRNVASSNPLAGCDNSESKPSDCTLDNRYENLTELISWNDNGKV